MLAEMRTLAALPLAETHAGRPDVGALQAINAVPVTGAQ